MISLSIDLSIIFQQEKCLCSSDKYILCHPGWFFFQHRNPTRYNQLIVVRSYTVPSVSYLCSRFYFHWQMVVPITRVQQIGSAVECASSFGGDTIDVSIATGEDICVLELPINKKEDIAMAITALFQKKWRISWMSLEISSIYISCLSTLCTT